VLAGLGIVGREERETTKFRFAKDVEFKGVRAQAG
jgi:hypothetical protein